MRCLLGYRAASGKTKADEDEIPWNIIEIGPRQITQVGESDDWVNRRPQETNERLERAVKHEQNNRKYKNEERQADNCAYRGWWL